MEIIYETLYNDILQQLIPDAYVDDFGDLNKIIALLLTYGIVWRFVALPLIHTFSIRKK